MIGAPLVEMDYLEKIERLYLAKIALWDVVADANRSGSLDQKITDAHTNDLHALVSRLPNLRAIAFNGKKAAMLGAAALDGSSIDILHLPSSSPANTLTKANKLVAWSALANFLAPAEIKSHI